ncbi:MAG: hypothetical protein WD513_01280 [Balneolaceae bacterium]
MNIDNFLNMHQNTISEDRRDELRKEQAAKDVEKIFAKHLVNEMTKNSFKMSDGINSSGKSDSLYREFITDALAEQLATEQRLGMADLISKYWDQTTESSE